MGVDGFHDHIKPPPDWSTGVDSRPSGGQLATVPYGPRVPFLAIGHFARVNYISHTVMEHSSVVRFLEWNYNGGVMGQLGRRPPPLARLRR